MTHLEYVSRLGVWTDADAVEVLAHVGGCVACATDARRADAALNLLTPRRRSIPEEIARWAAVAAILAVIALGIRQPEPVQAPASTARYRIVGNASGVVAYTPGGVIMGTAAPEASKEVLR